MKYYLGIDYFFFFEDFPHMGVPGGIGPNSDGTANIYINTLYCHERQVQAIKHELRHLAKNHFYCDFMTIEEKELDASNLNDPSCIFSDDFSSVEYVEEYGIDETPVAAEPAPDLLDVFFNPPAGQIACFKSLDAMTAYIQKCREQYRRAAGE